MNFLDFVKIKPQTISGFGDERRHHVSSKNSNHLKVYSSTINCFFSVVALLSSGAFCFGEGRTPQFYDNYLPVNSISNTTLLKPRSVGDCLVNESFISPEICDNGIDDDGDGLIDLNDSDCCAAFGTLPQTGWSLKYADSQETQAENGAAYNAFDGNPNTIWSTQWYGSTAPLPHEIQIDMGTTKNLTGFRYLPRQDGGANGRIGAFEFYVSTDGTNWGPPVSTGTFNEYLSPLAEKVVSFPPKLGRYIRLRALSEANGSPITSVAELRVDLCGAVENCANGVDDDADGLADSADPDCSCVAPTFSFQNPTLLSGTAGAVGAVYRFNGVLPGINANLSIIGKSHNDIVIASIDEPAATNGGYDNAFQPIINFAWDNSAGPFDPTGDEYVRFRIDFLTASDGSTAVMSDMKATAIDVDGNGDQVREFFQTSQYTSYEIASPTTLTLSGALRAMGSFPPFMGVAETALESMISFQFKNKSSITFDFGANYNGTVPLNTTYSVGRLNCLYFKCYNFGVQVPCPTVQASRALPIACPSPYALTSSVTGSSGTCGIQWQQSTDNVTWANIPGANLSSYTPPTVAATTYYRVYYNCSGNATCGNVYSNVLTVNVHPPCTENCTNGIDDDGDGLVDCGDSGCPSCVSEPCADGVKLISQKSAKATGAGASGTPSIANFFVPAGNNRALLLLANFEREHCQGGDNCTSSNSTGAGLGDNFAAPNFVSSGAAPQITASFSGAGGTISRQNPLTLPTGDLRFLNQSGFPSPPGTYSAAYLSRESYFIALYESDIQTLLGGSASGNISITLPDVTVPKDDADDAILLAYSFVNVEQSATGIVRSGANTYDPFDISNTSGGIPGNYTVSITDLDNGQEPNEATDGLLVLGFNGIGQPSGDGGFQTMAGFTELNDVFTNTPSGDFGTFNEPDGFSLSTQFIKGPSSGIINSVSMQSNAISSFICNGGMMAAFTIEGALCPEVCNNGLDDDGDGLVDCTDSNCLPAITTQPTGATICNGGTHTMSVTATSATGYQWQSSLDNVTFTNIAGATSSSYTTPTLAVTTYYRVQVLMGGCTLNSNTATITVVADPTITAQPVGTVICGSGSHQMSVTVTGGTPSLTYQWQSSTDNISFANIPGANTNSYTTPIVSANTFYRVIVSAAGNGCGSTTSTSAKLTVYPSGSPNCGSGCYKVLVGNSGSSGNLNQLDINGTFLSNLVAFGGSAQVSEVIAAPDGNILVAYNSNKRIDKFNAQTGAFMANIVPPGANGLGYITQLAIGPDGLLYVANAKTIHRFNMTTGAFVGTAVNNTGYDVIGVTFDKSGNLYASRWSPTLSNNPIEKYDANLNFITNVVVTNSLNYALALGPDGNIYFGLKNNSIFTIQKYNVVNGTNSVFCTLDAGSSVVGGFSWGPDGKLWLPDWQESEIHVYSSAGTQLQTITNSNISYPCGLAFTSCSDADFGDLPKTYPTTIEQNGPQHLISSPLRLGTAIDKDGNGQPSNLANFDDTDSDGDDEDGVFPAPLVAGSNAMFNVVSSGTGRLNAFFDWNSDGDFLDANEALPELAVSAGSNTLVVPVPASAMVSSKLGARFRLSSAGGLTAVGGAPDGEVEDYLVGGNTESCINNIDDDGDGLVDCADPDCANSFAVTTNATSSSVCLGQSTNISASAAGGGPFTYNWSNGLGNGISHNITPNSTTTYEVTVTNGSGCTATAQLTIVVNNCVENCTNGIDDDGDGLVDCDDPACGLTTSVSTLNATCGATNGTATISASGGSGSYEYSSNNSTWQLSNSFSGLAPGNYVFYVRNTNDACPRSLPFSIVELCENCTDGIDNDADGLVDCADSDCRPSLNLPSAGSICGGSSFTMTVSANGGTSPYTFNWSHGLGAGPSKTVSPGASTTYSVTVSTATACTASGSIGVTVTNCAEICSDAIDNDGDGLVDCSDPDCQAVGMPALANDAFTTCPGVPFGNIVSMNDGNLQNPVFTITTAPAKGAVVINNFGAFTYTPNVSNCTTDQFTYQVCNQTTGCCASANVNITIGDTSPPALLNVPADITISCDDEVPIAPVIFALDACPGIYVSLEETTTQASVGACSSYSITRTWTGTDLCGNSSTDSQQITVEDKSKPELFRLYTLPNGKKMTAGVAQNTSHLWKYVKFPVHFDTPPLVFVTVASNNDAATVSPQVRYVSNSGFQVRLMEEEGSDRLHVGEAVSWMAIEKGSVPGNSKLIADVLPTVNHTDQALTYSTPFDARPSFFAAPQTTNEADAFYVRTKTETASSISISLQEEQGKDAETMHMYEKIGYLAMTNGADLLDEDGYFIGENGSVNVNQNWVTVNLLNRYSKPVVILGGLPNGDPQAAVIRVRNITQTSFQVRVQEWGYLDGIHPDELLNYIVVEGGLPTDPDFQCFSFNDRYQPGINLFAIDNCDDQVAFGLSENSTEITQGIETIRTWVAMDDCGNVNLLSRTDTCEVAAVRLKTILDGGRIGTSPGSFMRDDLRSLQFIPMNEPYKNTIGFSHKGKGGEEVLSANLLNLTGGNALVDWLFVEVRNVATPHEVLATQSVVLQRDGEVTNVVGNDVVVFPTLPADNYLVSIRHRNHLGMTTATPWQLSTLEPPLLDFTSIELEKMGGSKAGKIGSNNQVSLWAGDLNGDRKVIYQGPNNDVFKLFTEVLANEDNINQLANFIVHGYKQTDLNLDGKSIYQGPNNDRAMLLLNSILQHPNNSTLLANYLIGEALP